MELIADIWSYTYSFGVYVFAIIGVLAVVLGVLDLLFKVIPELSDLKARCMHWFSDTFNYRRARKLAVKTDMENMINRVVFQLQRELPVGWVKRAAIKWVKDVSRPAQTPEEEIILRIRPSVDQNLNLAYGVHSFFMRTLFPRTGSIIPNDTRAAATLLITRRALSQHSPTLRALFEDQVMERAINEEPNIVVNLKKFEKLDNRGFFASALLREIHEVTNLARFDALRTSIGKELNAITEHMLAFAQAIGDANHPITDGMWSRTGPVTSYAFLLVARPNNSGSKNYVERARVRLKEGVNRLYILAREEQKDFAMQVVREIAEVPGYSLTEVFDLHKDYRYHVGGIGALLSACSTNDQE